MIFLARKRRRPALGPPLELPPKEDADGQRAVAYPRIGAAPRRFSRETLVGAEFGEGMTLDDYVHAIGLPSGGAVRASPGIATNRTDIDRFVAFAAEFIDLADVPNDLPPRTGC